MNPGDVAMFVAVGFIPTLIALELVYRMAQRLQKVEELQASR